MAKRTITINDGSKQREQVELNLNPVALTPTVRSGGQYNVVVQQTPKTNSALQLAQALRDGVGVYGQAVKVNQKRAAEDVATMTDEEYNKFLEGGLDKEGKSLFGYTKAYNEALAQKYYAETMPKKLQDIAVELHRDPYAYKDAASFEAAAEAAVNNAFEEADSLLGGNVFSERANEALKNVTASDFIIKQRASYIQKLPEITRQTKYEAAFRTFNQQEDLTQLPTVMAELMNSTKAAVGNKDSAKIVSTALMDEVDRAIAEGDTARAEAFLGALTDPQNGEYKIKVNGSEIFGTKANLIRLEGLEDKLEQAEVKGYETSMKTAKIALADASLDVQQALGMADDEQNLLDVITTWENEVRNNRSVTINGKTYDDPLVVAEISEYLSGAKNNTRLFRKNLRSQFISQHTGRDLNLLTQGIYSPDAIKQFSGDIYTKFVTTDPLTMKPSGFTMEGQNFQFEVNAQKDILQNNLYDSLLHLPVAERPLAYRTQYQAEVANPLRDFVNTKLEAYQKDNDIRSDKYQGLGYDEAERQQLLNNGYTQADIDILEDAKVTERRMATMTDVNSGGGANLKGALNKYQFDDSIIKAANYQQAFKENLFESPEERLKMFRQLQTAISYNGINTVSTYNPKNILFRAYTTKPLFGLKEIPIKERVERNKTMRDQMKYYGITVDELVNNKFNYKKDILISEVYNGIPDFTSFPVVLSGGAEATIDLVKAFKNDPTSVLTSNIESPYKGKFYPYKVKFDEIAEQYGIPVEAILNAQYQYFKSNNFIRN